MFSAFRVNISHASASLTLREKYERDLNRFKVAFISFFTPLVSRGEKGFLTHTLFYMNVIVRASNDADLFGAYELLKTRRIPSGTLLPQDEARVLTHVAQINYQLKNFFKEAVYCEKTLHKARRRVYKDILYREGGIDKEFLEDDTNW